MNIDNIKSGDLYELFSNCSTEDLDPIVQIVIGRISNFLCVDERYKKFQPDHTKYSDKIADEIRLFGGHSLRNILRGSGPDYAEIVVDVCKKLKVPYKTGQTVSNEKNILDVFLEKNLKKLSDEERTELVKQAKHTASSKNSSIRSVGLALVALRLGGWAGLGLSLMTPSYKVTIPCVLHIAYLRQKLFEQLNEPIESPSSIPSLLASEEASIAQESSDDFSLSVTDTSGEQLLSVREIHYSDDELWRKPVKGDGMSVFADGLMQIFPNVIVAHDINTTKYMRVVANGALVKAGDKEGYRALVMGGKGVKEHAKLFDPKALIGKVNFAAVFQIASVLVAQKHLWDINKKLDEIKQTISEIQHFQSNERRSRLSGNIRYFEQIAPSVREGDLGPDLLNKIELGESEFLQIQDHVCEDILSWKSELKDKFEARGKAKIMDLRSELGKLSNLCVEYFMCVNARVCGWYLLSEMPVIGGRKVRRKDDILRSLKFIEQMQECAQLLRKFAINTHYSRQKDNAAKLEFLAYLDGSVERMAAHSQSIKAELSEIPLVVDQASEQMPFLMKFENNELVGVRPV